MTSFMVYNLPAGLDASIILQPNLANAE